VIPDIKDLDPLWTLETLPRHIRNLEHRMAQDKQAGRIDFKDVERLTRLKAQLKDRKP
jgi:hypothetical protein